MKKIDFDHLLLFKLLKFCLQILCFVDLNEQVQTRDVVHENTENILHFLNILYWCFQTGPLRARANFLEYLTKGCSKWEEPVQAIYCYTVQSRFNEFSSFLLSFNVSQESPSNSRPQSAEPLSSSLSFDLGIGSLSSSWSGK
jgi:hypothetical protein